MNYNAGPVQVQFLDDGGVKIRTKLGGETFVEAELSRIEAFHLRRALNRWYEDEVEAHLAVNQQNKGD